MKIFISSVQREFAAERKALAKYIREFVRDAREKRGFKMPLNAKPIDVLTALELVDDKGRIANSAGLLFPDRLEVMNPGPLPKGMTVAKLKRRHKSMPVNPLLARAMYMRGYIEHVGSGTGDVIERCRARGLPAPVWENEDDGCVVTIRRALPRTTQESSPQISSQNLSDGARSVLKMVSADDRMKTQAMADELGVSKRMVLNYIKELASVGLHFEGPTKKGRWVIEKQPVNKKRGGTK